MTIKERRLNDVTILELDGKLTQEGSVVLRARSTAVIQGGTRKLILNLAHVEYIDGNGVGALTACYVTLRKLNGRLTLVHINDHLQQVFTLTKLSSVFETFDSESAALESYSRNEKTCSG
jgi:anti-sigma B factor antagonist